MTRIVKVSIVIPARNEEDNLGLVVENLLRVLNKIRIPYEIIIVDDCSTDSTGKIADDFARRFDCIKVIHRSPPPGFGRALREGFRHSSGDVIIPFMGDLSDEADDIIKLLQKIEDGYDMVFGSRFIKGGMVEGYPPLKLVANRLYNKLLRFMFGIKAQDITNAFKAYRSSVLKSINIESDGFEITAEIPLKAFMKGYSFTEVPVRWHRRKAGFPKLRLTRVGIRYLICALRLFFVFLKSRLKH